MSIHFVRTYNPAALRAIDAKKGRIKLLCGPNTWRDTINGGSILLTLLDEIIPQRNAKIKTNKGSKKLFYQIHSKARYVTNRNLGLKSNHALTAPARNQTIL
jgi:hypothetical protein